MNDITTNRIMLWCDDFCVVNSREDSNVSYCKYNMWMNDKDIRRISNTCVKNIWDINESQLHLCIAIKDQGNTFHF